MNDPPDALVNSRLALHLRIQAGLARRTLANQIGVSETVIRGIEDGHNHETLTLALVLRLATALGTTPPRLQTPDQTIQPPTDDDVIVESALATLARSVPAHDLATALDWTLERTVAALKALQRRLHGTGQALILDQWNKARLVPAPGLSDTQLLALSQLSPRQRGLTPATARVLRDLLNGHLDSRWLQRASRTDKDALSSLLNQGVLQTTRHGPDLAITLADDFAYLTDPPNRTSRDATTNRSIALTGE